MPNTAPIRIDIVSDVVCPWCIVGYRQLSIAAEETGIGVTAYADALRQCWSGSPEKTS